MKSLILGYGNPDRQDDGVAWTIVQNLATRLSLTPPSPDEPVVADGNADLTLAVALQLLPEMAELVAGHERVCFVDAHTGRVPEDLSIEKLDAQFQSSPFTHHLTPQTCLSLAQSLYSKTPEGLLVSVRGYEFGFSNDLSPRTRALADQAVDHILSWLEGSALQ
ncbi:MAG: hydrogenase maturation protease [Anaerolineaceae bacterium]